MLWTLSGIEQSYPLEVDEDEYVRQNSVSSRQLYHNFTAHKYKFYILIIYI